MSSAAATRIDIGVCTFRRPQLADTLRSLAALRTPEGFRVQVIVVDNDDVSSARAIAREIAAGLGLRLRYIHCPARNISLARNACLEASNADFLAFIDDDEAATPGWLAGLVEAAERDGADVVLGSRYVEGGSIRNWGFLRRLVSAGGSPLSLRQGKARNSRSFFSSISSSVSLSAPVFWACLWSVARDRGVLTIAWRKSSTPRITALACPFLVTTKRSRF
jgi:glycosyltransferase involved in cell wall biosynthesis